MLSASLSYRLIAQDLPKSLARTAAEPAVARETAYYQANIGKVKSIDDFLADKRLYTYAMKAYGLEDQVASKGLMRKVLQSDLTDSASFADMTYAKGFMRKLLEGGVEDDAALANKLTDSRYKDFAAAFDFAKYGAYATTFASANKDTTDSYVRQTLETEAGNQNDGARLALYFQRKASSITSAYGILADKALSQVVRTALGISPATASADIDLQAATIKSRLDIKDLQDPAKVAKFLTRFTARWEIDNPSTASTVPNILVGQTSSAGIGTDLLFSLQNLRLGGR